MPVFLMSLFVRAGIPERFRTIAAWIAAFVAIALLVGLLWLAVTHWLTGREETAVQIDRADATSEAVNRVMAADRAAEANQQASDDAFDNSQDQAKDKTDEAARARTSPLDALFNELH